MKKIAVLFTLVLCVIINIITCFAGDVPEGLLHNEGAMVYMGEVTDVQEEKVTIVVRQNIKGYASVDQSFSYDDWVYAEPKVGEVYLCGYFDENNPVYIWEVTGDTLENLNIIKDDNMSQRMEEYLNDGDFALAHEELVNEDVNNVEAISTDMEIIGSADGPTSIFVKNGFTSRVLIFAGIGVCVSVIAIVMALVLNKKKGN